MIHKATIPKDKAITATNGFNVAIEATLNRNGVLLVHTTRTHTWHDDPSITITATPPVKLRRIGVNDDTRAAGLWVDWETFRRAAEREGATVELLAE